MNRKRGKPSKENIPSSWVLSPLPGTEVSVPFSLTVDSEVSNPVPSTPFLEMQLRLGDSQGVEVFELEVPDMSFLVAPKHQLWNDIWWDEETQMEIKTNPFSIWHFDNIIHFTNTSCMAKNMMAWDSETWEQDKTSRELHKSVLRLRLKKSQSTSNRKGFSFEQTLNFTVPKKNERAPFGPKKRFFDFILARNINYFK